MTPILVQQSIAKVGDMEHDDLLKLIAAAKDKMGSDRQVAMAMGIPSQHVAGWKAGTRNPQPEDIALLAAIAGLEADKWALRAMIAKHEGTPKGDLLLKALGKGLLATGAVLISSGASAAVATFSATSSGLGEWAALIVHIPLFSLC